MSPSFPLPPFELADRVGSIASAEDPWETFAVHGESARAAIQAAVGPDFAWEGATVLDFGAGVGRTLRHFAEEMEVASFHASDIDEESVAWLTANFPRVEAFTNAETPPLDRPDGTFDLVYNVSVFTHLLDLWAEWLLELRRVIKPGGLLVCSFMGKQESQPIAGVPWDAERTGMFGFANGQSWSMGGPMVMHSQWWLREHWGRAFDVVGFVDSAEAHPWFVHSLVVLRHPGGPAPTVEELRAPGEDPREAPALQANLDYVQRECSWLRGETYRLQAELEGGGGAPSADAAIEIARLRAELDDAHRVLAQRDDQLRTFAESSSWRLAAPLRAAAAAARRARGR